MYVCSIHECMCYIMYYLQKHITPRPQYCLDIYHAYAYIYVPILIIYIYLSPKSHVSVIVELLIASSFAKSHVTVVIKAFRALTVIVIHEVAQLDGQLGA